MRDAFGRMLHDYHRGELADAPVHRRDDGVSWEVTGLLDWYFAPPGEWPDDEFEVLSNLDGRVLDVGCGAGRHALYLQGRDERGDRRDGIDPDSRLDRDGVVALDRSPLAVRTARERGVEGAVVGDMELLPLRGEFRSVLVAGGQLGAPGSIDDLLDLLGGLARATAAGGRLVGELLDPTAVEDPDRRAYLAANRLHEGVSVRRFRVEYDGDAGPWIDLLMLSPGALRDVVAGTAWRVGEILPRGESYAAVLERRERSRP